jgi:hypothetical protein
MSLVYCLKNFCLIFNTLGYSVLIYSPPTRLGKNINSDRIISTNNTAKATVTNKHGSRKKTKYKPPTILGINAGFQALIHFLTIIFQSADILWLNTIIFKIIIDMFANANDTAIPSTPNFTPQ